MTFSCFRLLCRNITPRFSIIPRNINFTIILRTPSELWRPGEKMKYFPREMHPNNFLLNIFQGPGCIHIWRDSSQLFSVTGWWVQAAPGGKHLEQIHQKYLDQTSSKIFATVGWKLVCNDRIWSGLPSQLQAPRQVQWYAAGVQRKRRLGEAESVRSKMNKLYVESYFNCQGTGCTEFVNLTCRRSEPVNLSP